MGNLLTGFQERRKEQLEQIKCRYCGKEKLKGEDKELSTTCESVSDTGTKPAVSQRYQHWVRYYSGWERVDFSECKLVRKYHRDYYGLDLYWNCPDCAEDKLSPIIQLVLELNKLRNPVEQ